MIYLASVYSLDAHSHSAADLLTRQTRYNTVLKKTAELLKQGHVVFSPIVHSHPMSKLFDDATETFADWQAIDENYITHCDEVWVLKMKGWQRSEGITKEVAFAIANGIPVRYIKVKEEEVLPTVLTVRAAPSDVALLGKLFDNNLAYSAPRRRSYACPHREITVGIGKDHTATVTMPTEAVTEMYSILSESNDDI